MVLSLSAVRLLYKEEVNTCSMLMHIGLNIIEPREVIDFYEEILGFSENKRFILGQDLSKKIFNINHAPGVFLLRKNDLVLELFVTFEKNKPQYRHICFEMNDRENIIKKALLKDYKVEIIKREEKEDMIFVWDKSDNIFELINIRR